MALLCYFNQVRSGRDEAQRGDLHVVGVRQPAVGAVPLPAPVLDHHLPHAHQGPQGLRQDRHRHHAHALRRPHRTTHLLSTAGT